MRLSVWPAAVALLVFTVFPSCGDTTYQPDGNLTCEGDDDCQDGYRCVDGACTERPNCTDFDGDGYCDEREGYEDCNDNRADIHPGAPEACDGQDNDCDDQVDEDCPCNSGDTQPCGSDVGVCTKGTQACDNGQWGPCQGGVLPAAEEDCLDEKDNDCNGAINDGCACNQGDSRDCGSHLGICTPGVQTCVEEAGEWHWSGCTGGTPPQEEICGDDLDNDCEGSLDNGCPCEDVSRPCGLNAGICYPGLQHCVDGVWRACQGARLPDDEICDGLDNDCDLMTDEGCECLDGQFEACGTDVGECSMGSRICVRGRWDTCDGEVPPVAEACDGRDNDCDGEWDEDFSDLLLPCSAGQGICARPGAWVCNADGSGLVCNATPGSGTDEFCNGLDDDCDGSTDEDFAGLGEACTRGQGECYSTGVTVCDPGGGYTCNAPEIRPQPELCDTLDNDCDGQADEHFPLGQACSAGVGECYTQGQFVCSADLSAAVCDANPPGPGVESCNNRDDDCDGRTDEDLERPCSTQCGDGYEFCVNGTFTNCSAPEPSNEVCDYQDNDCDGSTDEGIANLGGQCQAGTGACLSLGYYVCDGNGGVICNAIPGTPEGEGSNYTCEDGIDNDCDGQVDGNDGDCDSGCRNVSMEDLYGLQFLAGGLGFAFFRRRRRRKKRGSAAKGGAS